MPTATARFSSTTGDGLTRQFALQRRDPGPVGFPGAAGAYMAGGEHQPQPVLYHQLGLRATAPTRRYRIILLSLAGPALP
jgi:hypothetical protein